MGARTSKKTAAPLALTLALTCSIIQPKIAP